MPSSIAAATTILVLPFCQPPVIWCSLLNNLAVNTKFSTLLTETLIRSQIILISSLNAFLNCRCHHDSCFIFSVNLRFRKFTTASCLFAQQWWSRQGKAIKASQKKTNGAKLVSELKQCNDCNNELSSFFTLSIVVDQLLLHSVLGKFITRLQKSEWTRGKRQQFSTKTIVPWKKNLIVRIL